MEESGGGGFVGDLAKDARCFCSRHFFYVFMATTATGLEVNLKVVLDFYFSSDFLFSQWPFIE